MARVAPWGVVEIEALVAQASRREAQGQMVEGLVMSETKNDGGPAFPHPWTADMGWSPRDAPGGMSLRDWFAGQALASVPTTSRAGPMSKAEIAEYSYAIADAMLKAREQKP